MQTKVYHSTCWNPKRVHVWERTSRLRSWYHFRQQDLNHQVPQGWHHINTANDNNDHLLQSTKLLIFKEANITTQPTVITCASEWLNTQGPSIKTDLFGLVSTQPDDFCVLAIQRYDPSVYKPLQLTQLHVIHSAFLVFEIEVSIVELKKIVLEMLSFSQPKLTW